jgi:hypothetical protein
VTEPIPPWVASVLDGYRQQGLIVSWRRVADRGIVVVAADMSRVELKTERDAILFRAGVSSAITTYHGDPAHDGGQAPGALEYEDILALLQSVLPELTTIRSEAAARRIFRFVIGRTS